MARLINLNKARKLRVKLAHDAKAAENRTRFGRSKAERSLAQAKGEKAARELDEKKLS